MLKDIIKTKTCYLVTNELKKEILNYVNENKLLLDIHFFSNKEFIDRCYFSYDIKAVYHLVKNFNLSYSNSRVFIENIKYLMYSNKLNNSKYDYLLKLKESLDKENLLIYDKNFISFLNRYDIISDFDNSNQFINKIDTLLNNKIKFISNEIKDDVNIYQYDTSEEEIESISNRIASLLINNIDPNKIHILNYSSEYKNYIDKIFTLYNIPYHLDNESKLIDLEYCKEVFNNYKLTQNLELNDNYLDLNNQIINILNSINFINDFNDKLECFYYLLSTSKVKANNYSNIINFDRKIGYLLEDHYYFFIGLNNKSYPKYKKDEDYFSDIEKLELTYLTSYDANKILKQSNINKLKSNSNLFISYRLADYFNKYMVSDIVNSLTNNPISDYKSNNIYSRDYNRLKLTRELDDYSKFNIRSDNLINLLNILSKDDYKSYDNNYTLINKDEFLTNILNNNISISYSTLQTFSECKFKYYLDKLLNTYTDSFNTYIGSLCHSILEHIYDSDFDFDRVVNEYHSDYTCSKIETILIRNILEIFKNKVKIILQQYDKTKFKQVKKEENINIKTKTNLSIVIKGFIDKMMIDDSNNAIVIDYKTGKKEFKLDLLEYGLDCQLPFYFYLLNKSKEYADIFLVGAYIQFIDLQIKSYDKLDKDLYLDGLTYNDVNVIEKIDQDYKDNSFIKGMKVKKDGNFAKSCKLFDTDLFNQIIESMDKNIKEMIQAISECDFSINPKIISNDKNTCKYCKYKDICFKNFNNYIDLSKDGEEDAMD